MPQFDLLLGLSHADCDETVFLDCGGEHSIALVVDVFADYVYSARGSGDELGRRTKLLLEAGDEMRVAWVIRDAVEGVELGKRKGGKHIYCFATYTGL